MTPRKNYKPDPRLHADEGGVRGATAFRYSFYVTKNCNLTSLLTGANRQSFGPHYKKIKSRSSPRSEGSSQLPKVTFPASVTL